MTSDSDIVFKLVMCAWQTDFICLLVYWIQPSWIHKIYKIQKIKSKLHITEAEDAKEQRTLADMAP